MSYDWKTIDVDGDFEYDELKTLCEEVESYLKELRYDVVIDSNYEEGVLEEISVDFHEHISFSIDLVTVVRLIQCDGWDEFGRIQNHNYEHLAQQWNEEANEIAQMIIDRE